MNKKAIRSYSFSRDADDAVYARDGYDYDGYKLRVEFPRGGGGSFRGGRQGERRGRGPPARRSNYRVMVTGKRNGKDHVTGTIFSSLFPLSGLPPTGSWQDLKDHMRDAGDVCFSDVFKDGTGVVEYMRYEDMKYALKKLDDSRFKSHEVGKIIMWREVRDAGTTLLLIVLLFFQGETAYIRVKEDSGSSGGGGGGGRRSRSRSRSYSPRRSRGSPVNMAN